MVTFWKSLVQSKLDYCSQLCHHFIMRPKHILAQVAGLQDLYYWDRLQELHVYTQEHRRERYHIIFIWKCLQAMCRVIASTLCRVQGGDGCLAQSNLICSKKSKEVSLLRVQTVQPHHQGPQDTSFTSVWISG